MDASTPRSARLGLLDAAIGLAKDVTEPEPSRAEIDALGGATVLEFGTSWCGHCRAAQPFIAAAFAAHEGVRHVRIEDGSGRQLGRTFGVKLWPTLVFLADGRELARVVRPRELAPIEAGFASIDAPA